jgi:hypothetical protein
MYYFVFEQNIISVIAIIVLFSFMASGIITALLYFVNYKSLGVKYGQLRSWRPRFRQMLPVRVRGRGIDYEKDRT